MIRLAGAAMRLAVRTAMIPVPVLLVEHLGFFPFVPLAGNRGKEQRGGQDVENFHPGRM